MSLIKRIDRVTVYFVDERDTVWEHAHRARDPDVGFRVPSAYKVRIEGVWLVVVHPYGEAYYPQAAVREVHKDDYEYPEGQSND